MNTGWVVRQYVGHFAAALADLWPDRALQPNRRFQGLHRGQRCFILGSGPSIRSQDLTLLAGETVMTQNNFHVHEAVPIIRPRYHVVVPKYQPAEFDADWKEWLSTMGSALPQDTIFFLGTNTRYLVEQMQLFRDRAYYVKASYRTLPARRAPVDLTRSLLGVPTVLCECLAIAIYMEFSEVYLLGMDLDQVCRMNEPQALRFYGTSVVTRNQAERDVDEAARVSGFEFLQAWMIWRQCNLLKREADARGVRILNATRGGLLNMFERVRYEDLMGAAKR